MSFDTDKEVKNILFDLGVEGNEYGDLVEYISNLLAEVKRLREKNDELLEYFYTYEGLEAWLDENHYQVLTDWRDEQ
tara:strand:- start:2006 stop:2236 length:231 start_codon:yes stop_codon:yes gene_type:complete